MTLEQSIKRANAALHNADRLTALDELLAAWRTCRAPELASVLADLSADVARARPALDPGADDYDAAWSERETEHLAADIEHLVPGLWGSPKGSVPLRLRSLLARGPDPRVGDGLLHMIEHPPMTASSAFSTWTRLFKALPEHADARAVPMLEKRAKKHDGKSQFWPKLTAWIEAVIPRLPPPAVLPEAIESQVAALHDRVRVLAAGPAPVLDATPSKQPDASRDALEPAAALDAASRGLDNESLEEALEALRVAWQARRSPPLAVVFEKLAFVVDDKRPDLRKGKAAAVQTRWMKMAASPTTADVGRLLESLRDGKLNDVEERLSAMTRWSPDPRVATIMFSFIDDYMLGGRPLLWRLVYELLALHADPRIKARFERRCASLDGRTLLDRHAAENAGLRRSRERITEALASVEVLPAGERRRLESIKQKVGAIATEHGADDRADAAAIARFIDDIVATPDEDGPRLVFADWLIDRGDPYGELISLSLALEAGKKVKGKLARHRKTHAVAIEGPLAPLIYRERYERGFLFWAWLELGKGNLTMPAAKLEECFSDWRWALIEEIRLWSREGFDQVVARAQLSSIRSIEGASLSDLTALTRTIPLRSLEATRDFDDVDWARLDEVTRAYLPALCALKFRTLHEPPVELFGSALYAQLDELVVGSLSNGGMPRLDLWIERLHRAKARCPQVHVICADFDAQLRPAAKGRKLELELRFHGPWYGDEDWENLLAMLRRISASQVGEATCSYSFDSRDKRRKPLRDAIGHLGAKTVRYKKHVEARR